MTRKGLAFALAGLSVLTVSTASALPLHQHAASFQAARGVDQQFINRGTSGVSNSAAVNKQVVGTPPRNPHPNGNQTVSITGWNANAAVNSRCTVYSYSASGAFVASKTFCMGAAAGCIVPPAGHWIHAETFSVAEAPFNSSYVVYCTLLPAGANTNRIHSVRVSP